MPIVGVSKSLGISQHLKVYITQVVDGVSTTVVGFIGEGASKTLTSNWTPPFESDTLGNAAGVEKAAGLMQAGTGATSVTTHNSIMVWEGTTPPTLSIPVYFQAYADAKKEVDDAIMALEAMASPQLSAIPLKGRTPQLVAIDVGRRFKIPNALITEVSSELDVPRTKDGHMARNTVTLSITPDRTVNASDIKGLYY